MMVVPPVIVTDAMLTASNVPETDHPEWSSSTTYPLGYRVIKAAVHRVYESVAVENAGHDPEEEASSWWIEVGATNRWAMFDEGVGSATRQTDSIAVTIAPGQYVDTVAILDTDAVTVRVQVSVGGSGVYDETLTREADQANLIFRDLPIDSAASISVTASASGSSAYVEIGTLIVGAIVDLGITETGPSVAITDFSRRNTDDFGTTTVVERGWAKRMGIRSLIDAADADIVQRRLAALRARACLWIGEEEYDSLTIYGFFKDFSIDLSLVAKSYCTLTIEGLTNVPPLPQSPIQEAIDGLEDLLIKPAPDYIAKAVLLIKPNGRVGAIMLTNSQIQTGFDAELDALRLFKPGTDDLLFEVGDDGIAMNDVQVNRIKAGTGNSAQFGSATASGSLAGTGAAQVVLSKSVTLLAPGSIQAVAAVATAYSGTPAAADLALYIDGTEVFSAGGAAAAPAVPLSGSKSGLAAGTYSVEIMFNGPSTMTVNGRNIATTIIYD
ncbi:hypothetical protein [Sphingomonas sp. VDB2]|uniref:hypothetical protein n=1 Tax=Sphingomonas sp. VDB2 TaxID=3228751 RepID=UPI003A806FB9